MATQTTTTKQPTYRIRHLWMGGKGGVPFCDAVDAETGAPLPGTDSLDEEMLRWRMRMDYKHYAEEGTVRA